MFGTKCFSSLAFLNISDKMKHLKIAAKEERMPQSSVVSENQGWGQYTVNSFNQESAISVQGDILNWSVV